MTQIEVKMPSAPLPTKQRTQILVVEDEWIVAADIAKQLEDAGFSILGPTHSVKKAMELLDNVHPKLALLDINLRGETSYPIAEFLAARRIPFAFLSGYDRSQLRHDFQDALLIRKPASIAAVLSVIAELEK